jgi:hypothetical protein
MRELYNFRTIVVDDGDKGRTCGKHILLWVFGPPSLHELSCRIQVKIDGKYLCKFFDPKGANSGNHALEKSKCVISLLFRDVLQDSFIRVIEGGRQFD